MKSGATTPGVADHSVQKWKSAGPAPSPWAAGEKRPERAERSGAREHGREAPASPGCEAGVI